MAEENHELRKEKDKGMDSDINEKSEKYVPKEIPEEVKKEMEKTKQKLELFRKNLLKKFNYLSAVALMPPQASKIIEEEEEVKVDKEKDKDAEKLMHVLILLPDEKDKELAKVKAEAIKLVQDFKPKVWLHVKLIKDLWEISFDGKYDYLEAISMSYPLHDRGILGALRVASIHKTLVLRKFEKYVVSYVIAGSVVRGTATKTSDVDIYVVIDDTDVRRMSRLELKEKLRAIIHSYVIEAGEIAGVKNKLSPQIYILTEFWEAVKDAHPVIFTFIRDGVPFYDRGAFMPWKLLLRMGKIKPSPEAIDMFMSLGDRVNDVVKRKLLDVATEDIYWGIITPSQAILMLYGVAPPTPRETIALMKEIFVEKEKMLEQKYIDILEEVVEIYKGYEHQKVKEISGKKIDELMEKFASYIKRLKELMIQIEAKTKEKTILRIYKEIFDLLEKLLGKGNEDSLISRFKSQLVDKGKMPERNLTILKEIAKAKKDYKKKLGKQEVEQARKDAFELISHLIEYAQRCELASIEKQIEKNKLRIKYDKKEIDAFCLHEGLYVIMQDAIKKITTAGIFDVSKAEFERAFEKKQGGILNQKILSQLKKLLGDFEIVF
ncbi:nucleotidyltransferase domain-containing protein [Candidatus Pacearchaeota archaeon]|nr:nucleotidyltransferase domain-containing protein [Candidatus Pacearchaeota archaeon]